MNDITHVLARIAKHIAASNFKEIWNDCDRSAAFALCNKIRQQEDLPMYTSATFDHGFQYRVIFAPKFKDAKTEFMNLIFGLW